MHHHTRIVCKGCGKVILTCRCMEPKVETYSDEPCEDCKSKSKTSPSPEMSDARKILIKVNGCKASGEDCFFSKCTHWGCCGLLDKEFTEALQEMYQKGVSDSAKVADYWTEFDSYSPARESSAKRIAMQIRELLK